MRNTTIFLGRMKHTPQFTLIFFAILLTILSFMLSPAIATTATISGFAITPSKVEAFVPQGRVAEVSIYVLGVKPQGYRVVWYSGAREGINITVRALEEANGTILRVSIYAYRPGFYQYRLLIELPVTNSGPVRAIPVVSVPITVIVPGVRVTLTRLEIDSLSKTVYFCVGLVPYGPRENRSYTTRVGIRVDNKIVEQLVLTISKGTKICKRLGPFPPASIHTLTVTAEAFNISFDGVTTEFAIGRLTATLSINLQTEKLQLLLLGGIVKATYTVKLVTNSSSCTVLVTANLGGYTIHRSYKLTGSVGGMNTLTRIDTIARYVEPNWLMPFHTIPLDVNARAVCLGITKPVETGISTTIAVFDATPLIAYGGLAALLASVYRRKKKRRQVKPSAR